MTVGLNAPRRVTVGGAKSTHADHLCADVLPDLQRVRSRVRVTVGPPPPRSYSRKSSSGKVSRSGENLRAARVTAVSL
jgi:hypothetical protein